MLAKEVETLEPARGGNNLVPVAGKHILQQITVHLIVIDNQDLNHRRSPYRPARIPLVHELPAKKD
jgi:hypothetical protein